MLSQVSNLTKYIFPFQKAARKLFLIVFYVHHAGSDKILRQWNEELMWYKRLMIYLISESKKKFPLPTTPYACK